MLTKIETLKASGAVLVGSVTGSAVKFQQNFHKYTFVLDVTALADDADDTLDVYLDTSFDGGTTWINFAHFSQILGNGSAAKHLVYVHETVNTELDVTSDVGVGAVRAIGLGDRIRYRSVVVDPTGADASFTFSLKAFFKNGNH